MVQRASGQPELWRVELSKGSRGRSAGLEWVGHSPLASRQLTWPRNNGLRVQKPCWASASGATAGKQSERRAVLGALLGGLNLQTHETSDGLRRVVVVVQEPALWTWRCTGVALTASAQSSLGARHATGVLMNLPRCSAVRRRR